MVHSIVLSTVLIIYGLLVAFLGFSLVTAPGEFGLDEGHRVLAGTVMMLTVLVLLFLAWRWAM